MVLHILSGIHLLRLLLQNLLADLLSNTVLILFKMGVTENTQYFHSLRLYLHSLLADIIDLLGYTVLILINRIQGKSVHARAFALERQQSPVSYVGIDIVSRTILKIMYRTISNSTFDDESR